MNTCCYTFILFHGRELGDHGEHIIGFNCEVNPLKAEILSQKKVKYNYMQ